MKYMKEYMSKKFDIEYLACASCQLTVKNSVKDFRTDSVNISLFTNTIKI